MGGKLGTLFARAGHEVVFSYARSNEKRRNSEDGRIARLFQAPEPAYLKEFGLPALAAYCEFWSMRPSSRDLAYSLRNLFDAGAVSVFQDR